MDVAGGFNIQNVVVLEVVVLSQAWFIDSACLLPSVDIKGSAGWVSNPFQFISKTISH
jgi:hypothetical protein